MTWASARRNRFGCPLVALEPGRFIVNEASLPNLCLAYGARWGGVRVYGFYIALWRWPFGQRHVVRLHKYWITPRERSGRPV